ncbi:cob(I)yrinic acid a,c-diamide adenosyltransferase [Thermodesulfobacteriota bacterium]
MKIYTEAGDRGRTGLFSGERVPKSHLRIEAYGDVDELNAVLGLLIAGLDRKDFKLTEELHKIQSDLLHIGAWLSTTPGSPNISALKEIGEDDVNELEAAIDRFEKDLPDLNHFILPGGHFTAAWAHVARTVCRRAERHVVRLSIEDKNNGKREGEYRGVIIFLNRLSDYFFMLARHLNHVEGVEEALWEK